MTTFENVASPTRKKIKYFSLAGMLILLLLTVSVTFAATVIGEIPLENLPGPGYLNPFTNRMYLSLGGPQYAVFDTITNTVIEKRPLPELYTLAALNPVTNRLYALAQTFEIEPLLVLDGATNNIVAWIEVDHQLFGYKSIAVNPITNRIYVAASDTIIVIDGLTNTVIDEIQPEPLHNHHIVAVNPITNRIYLPDFNYSRVSVFDGATHTFLADVPVGRDSNTIAINHITNHIYVTSQWNSALAVIDGATNTLEAMIAVENLPIGLAVNPGTNHIFVTGFNGTDVQVIDGASNTITQVLPVGLDPHHIAANPLTNRVYVMNTTSSSITLIDDSATTPPPTAPVLTAPRTYSSCPTTTSSDTLTVDNTGNRWLRGRVTVNYVTGPTSKQPVPNGVYTVDHHGPAPFQLTVAYPPVSQWPSFINPSTGKPIRSLHVDVQIEVWNANGQPVRNPDGSVMTLGSRQDWGLFCRAVP